VATLVVFLTDDARVLRLAVVAAAWAFVLAALVASRRPPDGAPRDPFERADLDRAAAEREAELRRTTAQSVRAELEALRAELASIGELRREVARVAELRRDLAGLAELRSTLAELRTDVGRLRTEPAEQLSGEMLVERVTLRTQSTRSAPAVPQPAPRTVEADSWTSPAHELTAAWSAVRADEPAVGTRESDGVRAEPRRAPAQPPPPLLPDTALTTERPVAQRERPPVPAAAVTTAGAPVPASEDSGRPPAGLLAESGPTPPSGGRRRRRYREDDEADDVLARVLGRS
jgi:hypothetical protein